MKTIEKAAVKNRSPAEPANHPALPARTHTTPVHPELVEGFVQLSTVVSLNPRKFTSPISDDDIVSFVPMKCVEEETGNLDPTTLRPWHEVKKGYTAFQDNDVIFAKITPCMENGKFAIARGLKGGRAAGSTEFHVLRPNERLSPNYLMHFLFQHHIRQDARMNMRGAAGQLRVPTDFFESLRIPLPPLPTQHRIVAEIEEKLSRLDAAQSALLRARANLKRYRASILALACTGDFPVHPFGDICQIQGGIQKQPKRAPIANHFPFLRVANVLRGRLKLEDVHQVELFGEELKRLRLENGDLLIVEGNGSPAEIGRMAIWRNEIADCVHQNHIIRARPSAKILPDYAAIYWNSPLGQDAVQRVASSSSGLYTLSVRKLAAIGIPLPSIKDQQKIVEDVERRVSVIDSTEQTLRTQLERAKRLRQSILQQAFSPTRQDA